MEQNQRGGIRPRVRNDTVDSDLVAIGRIPYRALVVDLRQRCQLRRINRLCMATRQPQWRPIDRTQCSTLGESDGTSCVTVGAGEA